MEANRSLNVIEAAAFVGKLERHFSLMESASAGMGQTGFASYGYRAILSADGRKIIDVSDGTRSLVQNPSVDADA
jgi:hypothetical protein